MVEKSEGKQEYSRKSIEVEEETKKKKETEKPKHERKR